MNDLTFADVAQMLVESGLVYKDDKGGYYNNMLEYVDLREYIEELTRLLREF